MAINIPRGVELLSETDRQLHSLGITEPEHPKNRLIYDGFKDESVGELGAAILFNIFMSIEVGTSIYVPTYSETDDVASATTNDEETGEIGMLMKITRNTDSYSYEIMDVTPELRNLLLSIDDERVSRNEFTSYFGALDVVSIQRFIKAINHIQRGLCVRSTFSGGTGGTGRNHRKRTHTRRRKKSRKHRTLKRNL